MRLPILADDKLKGADEIQWCGSKLVRLPSSCSVVCVSCVARITSLNCLACTCQTGSAKTGQIRALAHFGPSDQIGPLVQDGVAAGLPSGSRPPNRSETVTIANDTFDAGP